METEWIILADYAEVLNGKLYTMGGGWEHLAVNALPAPQSFAVAASFLVPWNETNQLHDIAIELLDQDGATFATIDGGIEVGRPPGIPLGQSQRVMLGVNVRHVFEKLGTFVVRTTIEQQESKRLTFRVIAGPQLAAQQVAGPMPDRPSGPR